MLDLITKAVCLVLDRRINMFPQIQDKWWNLNINVESFLCGNGTLKCKYDFIDEDILPPIYSESTTYTTWNARPNAYNCWKCHYLIFKQFCQDNIDGFLLVIEDDCQIEPDFNEILTKIEPFFKIHSFDLLNFGAYLTSGLYEETENEHIIKLTGRGAGLHCCMLSRRLCRDLLEERAIGPFDYILEQKYHKKYNCYTIWPQIVSQRNNEFSFIEGCILSKPERWIR